MIRRTRSMLMSGTALAAAVSLAFGGVAVAEDDDMEATASMEPAAEMADMSDMEPGLYVLEPWARESPMLDLAGAAYMVIHNNTDEDDALVGASSPAAEVVELHLSSMDDEGMMSMNQVMEIAVPAHAEAVLKPGSYHVMLIDLVEPLVADTEIELSLEFMVAEPQTISLPVLAGGPAMMGDMGDDDMDMDDDMAMDDDMDEGEDD